SSRRQNARQLPLARRQDESGATFQHEGRPAAMGSFAQEDRLSRAVRRMVPHLAARSGPRPARVPAIYSAPDSQKECSGQARRTPYERSRRQWSRSLVVDESRAFSVRLQAEPRPDPEEVSKIEKPVRWYF